MPNVGGFLWITQNICSISLLEVLDSSPMCFFFCCKVCFPFGLVPNLQGNRFFCMEYFCLLKFGHIFFLCSFRRTTNWNYPHTFWYCLPMWLSLCVNIVVDMNNSNQICSFFGCRFLLEEGEKNQGKNMKFLQSKSDLNLKLCRMSICVMRMMFSMRDSGKIKSNEWTFLFQWAFECFFL